MPRTGSGCSCVDGRFAGEVSLGSVQRGPFQMGYVGYWIDEAQAGHGYVPEGVVLMMQHAFDVLHLHRLEAAIVPRNQPSRRVAEKLGLRDEGTAVKFLQIQGTYEDHVRYAITARRVARPRRPARRAVRQSVTESPVRRRALFRRARRGSTALRGRAVSSDVTTVVSTGVVASIGSATAGGAAVGAGAGAGSTAGAAVGAVTGVPTHGDADAAPLTAT